MKNGFPLRRILTTTKNRLSHTHTFNHPQDAENEKSSSGVPLRLECVAGIMLWIHIEDDEKK